MQLHGDTKGSTVLPRIDVSELERRRDALRALFEFCTIARDDFVGDIGHGIVSLATEHERAELATGGQRSRCDPALVRRCLDDQRIASERCIG